MALMEDGRLYPCNADAPWRQECEMRSAWIEMMPRPPDPDPPLLGRYLAQWRRLAKRDKGWRHYLGITRPPRCWSATVLAARVVIGDYGMMGQRRGERWPADRPS